jgi:hypothetical protein
MLLCAIKLNNMNEVTFQLTNQNSIIGFETMVLTAITEQSMWFKCYYTTKIDGVEFINICLESFDMEDYYNIIKQDYTITSK